MAKRLFFQTDFPCRDCQERHVGCHSDCERYKNAKEKREQTIEEYDRKHIKQNDIDGYYAKLGKKIKGGK